MIRSAFAFFLAMVLVPALPAMACSAFCKYSNGDLVICGDNDDVPSGEGVRAYVSPAGLSKTSGWPTSDGNVVKNPKTWTAKYATMYLSQFGGQGAQRMVNAAGLFGTLHAGSAPGGTAPATSLPGIPTAQFLNYIGDLAGNLHEARDLVDGTVSVLGAGGLPVAGETQFFICETGSGFKFPKCGAFEFDPNTGALHYTEIFAGDPRTPTVYTNHTYAESLLALGWAPLFSPSVAKNPINSFSRFRTLAVNSAPDFIFPELSAASVLDSVRDVGPIFATQWQTYVTPGKLAFRSQASSLGLSTAVGRLYLESLPLSLMNKNECNKGFFPKGGLVTFDVNVHSDGGDVSGQLEAYNPVAVATGILTRNLQEMHFGTKQTVQDAAASACVYALAPMINTCGDATSGAITPAMIATCVSQLPKP